MARKKQSSIKGPTSHTASIAEQQKAMITSAQLALFRGSRIAIESPAQVMVLSTVSGSSISINPVKITPTVKPRGISQMFLDQVDN